MNIEEALLKYEPTTKVKIGSADGEAYWFTGTVEEVNALEMDDVLRERANAITRRASQRVKDHLNTCPTLQDYLKKELEKDAPNPTTAAYIDIVRAYFQEGVRRKNTYLKRLEALRNFKHVLQREVVEIAPCDPAVEPNCIRVLIEGTERGTLWTTDEAREPGFHFTKVVGE